ncbi:MAG: Ca-activated chloride channel [Gaiellales bacterium]|jgi:Ca-activated chloride channel family protein|nr:Ca-activated chloride channel [Gaiellales bacterium]
MTFEWPLGLLALLLVPAALALLWLARRRQARYAVRFSNVDVLAAVARATRSPWRYLPPALFCAALAALAVGLARPQVSISAVRKQGTVVLALDRSGSMLAQDVNPDRISASRQAATSFVKNLPSGFSVGVVTFSDSADAATAPTRDKVAAQKAIASIRAGGGTAIGDAIERSLGLLGVTNTTTAKAAKGRAILLLSDGSNTQGIDPSTAVAEAKRAGVPVYTIALGTPDGVLDLQALGMGSGTIPVPPDPEALRAIARDTGGQSFTALDQGTLKKVYDQIGTRVSSTKQQKEITFIVAGAAAALLLAAAASSWALRITT